MSVSYRQNDNYTDIYMARWQIVVKKSEATKQTRDQNDNKNKQTTPKQQTTTKREEGGEGLKSK